MSFIDELKWSLKWGAILGAPSVILTVYGVWHKSEVGNLPWPIQFNVVLLLVTFVSVLLFCFCGLLRYVQARLVALMLRINPRLKTELAKSGIAMWWCGLYTDGSSTLNSGQ